MKLIRLSDALFLLLSYQLVWIFLLGYPLYLTLLGGALAGITCGVLAPFRNRESLRSIVPAVQRQCTAISVALYCAFVSLVSWQLVFSGLRMIGI